MNSIPLPSLSEKVRYELPNLVLFDRISGCHPHHDSHREKFDSADIKSEIVRDRVQNALTKIMQYLKLHKEIPENGLAIFAGTFATNL